MIEGSKNRRAKDSSDRQEARQSAESRTRSRNLLPELRKRIQRRLRHVVPFDLFPRSKFRRGARLLGPAYHAAMP
jgi:hypothetical protein